MGGSKPNRHSRRADDLDKRLWQSDQKLIDTQGKLTSANLELQRLRSNAETHNHELSMVKRMLEREQREKAPLQAELTSLKEQLKSMQSKSGGKAASPGGDGSLTASGERVLLLKAQLEEAGERSKVFAKEAERLRDEVSKLKAALEQKGEAGVLLKELTAVKDERVRLALELHEAKATASRCKEEAAEARQQMAAVAQLREALDEAVTSRDAARAEVERLSSQGAASQEEHGALLKQARGMADELESLRSSNAQLAEQKLALIERLNATESTLSALRTELGKREDDFQVDLGIFAKRDESQRAHIDKQNAENNAARTMIEELTASLEQARAQNAELHAELEHRKRSGDEALAQLEQAEAARREAVARAETSEVELRRDRRAFEEKSDQACTKETLLAQRLEGTLRELQGVLAERDRLSATLEEALTRCTSSLVAKQLAEDDCRAAQQQLDAYRAQCIT